MLASQLILAHLPFVSPVADEGGCIVYDEGDGDMLGEGPSASFQTDGAFPLPAVAPALAALAALAQEPAPLVQEGEASPPAAPLQPGAASPPPVSPLTASPTPSSVLAFPPLKPTDQHIHKVDALAGGTVESYIALLVQGGLSKEDAAVFAQVEMSVAEEYFLGADMARVQLRYVAHAQG
jgi:hypothetical protein